MNTFAKNIFLDSNGLIKILKIANEQQGGTLTRDQLAHYTEQVKRSRQSLDDWGLYSSLQDGSEIPKINEIKHNHSQLIKLSLPCLKEPSKLSTTLPIILQTFYNISRILYSILRDQANEVEGLLDVIKQSEEKKEENKNEIIVNEGLNTNEFLSQRKILSMAVLVDLKQITAIVFQFILSSSLPDNSSIFATTARSIIQNTLALVQFLAKNSPTPKADSLKQLIMNLVSVSKEIIQHPTVNEEVKQEQSSKIEAIRAGIATTLKDILSAPLPPGGAGNEQTSTDTKRRLSGSAIVTSENLYSTSQPLPVRHNTVSSTGSNNHPLLPNRLLQNQRPNLQTDSSNTIISSGSQLKHSLNSSESEPLSVQSYKSADDATKNEANKDQPSIVKLNESSSMLNDSFQQSSPVTPLLNRALASLDIHQKDSLSHANEFLQQHRSSSLASHSIDSSFPSVFTSDSDPSPSTNSLLNHPSSEPIFDDSKKSVDSVSIPVTDDTTLPPSSPPTSSPLDTFGKEGGAAIIPPLVSSGSFTNIQEITEKQQKKLIERQHAFKEIITSEKIYFKNLQFVYWGIILPLEELAKDKVSWITEQEINLIFSNWKSLMFFNKELMKRLEHKKNIPIEEREVGATFLELAPHMKMYTQFINDFDASSTTLELCLQKDEFYNFIQKCLEGAPTQGLDMRSYLIMPVQRLPRYEMLLRALWKLTDDHHFDFTNLANAVTTVKGINDHVNSKNRENANKAIVVDIQRKISGLEKDLVAPHRSFIREGNLCFINSVVPKKAKKKELFYFFLFNDMLLRCKFNKKKNSYDYKEHFELSDFYLRDIKYNPFMSNTERFCFKIVKQIDEKVGVSFFASSEEEKKEWVFDIEQVIKIRDAADNTRMSITS